MRNGGAQQGAVHTAPVLPFSLSPFPFVRPAILGVAAHLHFAALLGFAPGSHAKVLFETYSAYHHIEVVEAQGIRTLSFDGSRETQMAVTNPLAGHFEYTEFFHTPWIWNRNLDRVLMIGLGGGSTQRSFQHYYTNVHIDSVEIDPAVVKVARQYFGVTETPRHKIHVADGRLFLLRSSQTYDAIIMDAYTTTRYGSTLPPHLVTKEFFEMARDHLTTNGVLAYNVIGQTGGLQADIVGAVYRTLQEVFPQVYLFSARTSRNVVLVATRTPERYDYSRVQKIGAELVDSKVVTLPDFKTRLRPFQSSPPPAAANSPILTDDRTALEGLMRHIPGAR